MLERFVFTFFGENSVIRCGFSIDSPVENYEKAGETILHAGETNAMFIYGRYEYNGGEKEFGLESHTTPPQDIPIVMKHWRELLHKNDFDCGAMVQENFSMEQWRKSGDDAIQSLPLPFRKSMREPLFFPQALS